MVSRVMIFKEGADFNNWHITEIKKTATAKFSQGVAWSTDVGKGNFPFKTLFFN